MITVVRLFPHYDVDKVWQYAERSFLNMKGDGVVPLFMSEQDHQNHVSVICEVRELDALADFLIEQIGPCNEVAFTRTVTLLRPAFYPVAPTATNSLCRFLVPLKIYPKKFAEIYNKILKLEPPDGVHVAYIAFSLGEEDMIVSLLADHRESVIGFVSGRLEDVGIESIRIGVTHRTKRLVDEQRWRDCQARYARSRLLGGKVSAGDYSFDWTGLTRCCVHGPPHEGT